MATIHNPNNRESGAFTILAALAMVGLIGVAALAIDIGYGLVVKSELQNVADTGSLAANRELALIYKGTPGSAVPYWGTYTLSSTDKARIEVKVNTFSQQNKAGGKPISIPSSDMVYGKWNNVAGQITPTSTGVLAIGVTARRDQTANTPISTWLGRIFGVQSLSIRANSPPSTPHPAISTFHPLLSPLSLHTAGQL